MKELDINYFCNLAQNSITGMDFASINVQLLDIEYYQEVAIDIIDITTEERLRQYGANLISHVFFEQANYISQDREYDFDPIELLNTIVKEQYNLDIDIKKDYPRPTDSDSGDYLDIYQQYFEFLNDNDGIFDSIVFEAGLKMQEILIKDDEFMKNFNEWFEDI